MTSPAPHRNITMGLWEWNLRTNEITHDEGVTAITGCVIDTVETWTAIVHPDDRDHVTEVVAADLSGNPATEVHYRLLAADNSVRNVIHRCAVVESDAGGPVRMVGTAVDATLLHQTADRVEDLLDSMTDAYFALTPRWRFSYLNRAAERLLEQDRDDLLGTDIWSVFDDPSGAEFKAQYATAMTGARVEFEAHYAPLQSWYEVRAHPIADGIAVYFRDVTARRLADAERDALLRAAEQAQAKLVHAALHDPLTGLPNRCKATQWLERELGRSDLEDPLTVLFVDLDRFKLVNDTHGHAEGDTVLIESARRLCAAAPAGALVARLGGDDFIIGLPSGGVRRAAQVAGEVLDAFRRPTPIGQRSAVLTATVGVAVADARATASTLLRDADAAMYQAKDEGRNRLAVFADRVRRRSVRRLEIEADLREALDRDQLSSHYQPIFDASTGCPDGAEALVRWQWNGRMIPPDDFIPIAEDSGLIVPLGERMLDQAVTDAADLSDALGPLATTLWVNVSARQLEDPAFADRLLDRHARCSLTIGVEITERVLADGPAVTAVLTKLRTAGIPIAIDDFGTGYSSLSALRRNPVDMVKIDKSFVDALRMGQGTALVAAIIDLSHAVGAQACAEGVETSRQLLTLCELGADKVSGFHLSRPGSVAGLRRTLRTEGRQLRAMATTLNISSVGAAR